MLLKSFVIQGSLDSHNHSMTESCAWLTLLSRAYYQKKWLAGLMHIMSLEKGVGETNLPLEARWSSR